MAKIKVSLELTTIQAKILREALLQAVHQTTEDDGEFLEEALTPDEISGLRKVGGNGNKVVSRVYDIVNDALQTKLGT